MAKLPADTPVTVEGPREGLLDRLLLGEQSSNAQIEAALLAYEKRTAILSQLPPSLRAHVASLSPLLNGETAVVALPLAITLH